MDNNDELDQQRAFLDNAVYNALFNINRPGKDSLRAATKVVKIAYDYKKALLAAAQEAPEEIAEHYTLLATESVPKAEFLMRAILNYRGRQGIK